MRTQEKRDYYEVLGVPRDAAPERIRSAYLMLSRRLHPDVAADEESARRFGEVAEAYEVLSSPDSKLLYDRLAYRGPGNRGFGPPHPGVGKPTADSTHVSDEELLDWIFTGRPPGRPRHVVGELRIGSVEAERGTTRSVNVETYGRCVDCRGSGLIPAPESPLCGACHGAGRNRVSTAAGGRLLVRVETCVECDGVGRAASAACPRCGGTGEERSRRHVNVYVPAGVRDGQELVVDRVTGVDSVDRNAIVVLRVAQPRSSHRPIQVVAAALLLVVLVVTAALLIGR